MVYRVLHYGEEPLRNESQPVEKIDNDIRRLVEDMFETMYASNGVGLAAPQIG
ncbi:MAG: peptide deformylase, partial [Candidatus Rifleibacteriota bacterium]